MKVDKELNLAQLTQELLPLGVNSLVYDRETKELRVKGGNVSDADLQSAIDAHVPQRVPTRSERKQKIRDASTLSQLKDALEDLL